MQKRLAIVVVFGLTLIATPAWATPISYDVQGTFDSSLNGNDAVTGSFTLDADLGTITDFHFDTPVGMVDPSLSDSANLIDYPPLVGTTYSGSLLLDFSDPGGFRHFWMVFASPWAEFDPATFAPGQNDYAYCWGGGTVFSGLEDTSSPGFFGLMTTGSVTPSPVPEPASFTLLGMGLTGLGVRTWRRHS